MIFCAENVFPRQEEGERGDGTAWQGGCFRYAGTVFKDGVYDCGVCGCEVRGWVGENGGFLEGEEDVGGVVGGEGALGGAEAVYSSGWTAVSVGGVLGLGVGERGRGGEKKEEEEEGEGEEGWDGGMHFFFLFMALNYWFEFEQGSDITLGRTMVFFFPFGLWLYYRYRNRLFRSLSVDIGGRCDIR